MVDESKLQQPPPGIEWLDMDVLAEVARVATEDFEREKKAVEPRRRLVVRFKSNGNKKLFNHVSSEIPKRELLEVKKVEKRAVFNYPLDRIPRKSRSLRICYEEPKIVDPHQEEKEAVEQRRRSVVCFKTKVSDEAKEMVVPLRACGNITREERTDKRKLECQFLEGPENKKRKVQEQKKNQKRRVDFQKPEHSLPHEFKKKLEELGYHEEAVLVIQKELFNTDLSKNNNRFSIPEGQMRPGIFTKEVEAMLNSEKAVGVQLVDPCLRVSSQNLKKWEMKRSSQYVLIKNWYKEVVLKNLNVLKKGQIVQLWAARQETQLCFALVVVRAGRMMNDAAVEASSSSSSSTVIQE